MLQASSHQGSEKFRGRGRQCMANSLCSIIAGLHFPHQDGLNRQWMSYLKKVTNFILKLAQNRAITGQLMTYPLKLILSTLLWEVCFMEPLRETILSKHSFYTVEDALHVDFSTRHCQLYFHNGQQLVSLFMCYNEN